jgi:hypothetical protein
MCELVVLDEDKKQIKNSDLETEKQKQRLAFDLRNISIIDKFEENLKKIDSFQKIICNQEIESISSLITSLSKKNNNLDDNKLIECKNQLTSLLKSDEAHAHHDHNQKHSTCVSCSVPDETLNNNLSKSTQEKTIPAYKHTAKSILDRLDHLKKHNNFKQLIEVSKHVIRMMMNLRIII